MQIDVTKASALEVYRTLIDVVTPRPIAWVSTIDSAGVVNVAPFSFFNTFGGSPPIVVFSPNLRRDGSKKDTLRNIETGGEFVVNVAVEELATQVNLTSSELPFGESEADLAGLRLRPSVSVKPPAVADSPVQMECKLVQVLSIGSGRTVANLVIGEIVMFHLDDRIIDPQGRVDPRKLKSIARLGGDYYCRSSDLFEMKRPERH
jgi:flavin reductase (DIM6/NTAB) family NADH-FMN oxidoreductase RutF